MALLPSRDRPSTFVISITPFDRDGAIDESLLRGHLRRLAASGIGVYVGGGGSGEGYSLSRDDNARLFDIAVEELKGIVPVRAMGVEPRTAAQMIEFLTLAKTAGVDAAQVYALDVGHAHTPTSPELDAYFAEVIDAAELPVIVSTHQSVGYRIAPERIVELAKSSKVIGVNCTHPDLAYLTTIIDGVGATKDVHVGGPMQALSALALGAQGYLSSEGNLAPRLCVSLIEAYRMGDLTATMAAYAKIVRLSAALYGNGGIRVTKAVLNHFGMPGGFPRKPRLPVEDDRLNRALAVVSALDLGQKETW